MADWVVGGLAGLAVLVAATIVLAVMSVSQPNQVGPRPFMTDFATILLFCAASIAAAVLVLEAIAAGSELVMSCLLFGAAGAILVDLRRRELSVSIS